MSKISPFARTLFAAAIGLVFCPLGFAQEDTDADEAGATDVRVGQPQFPAAGPATTGAARPAPPKSLEPVLASLAEDRLFRTAKVALQVVDVETGEEVFSRNADQAMIPASTMKVVTAATALRTLGPSYRFTTDVLVDDDKHIDSKGQLEGNLYVQGHADPTLVIERLWKLVYDLKLQGITKVQGDVIYDEGYFGAEYLIAGWHRKDDIENGPNYFPSIGALSLNYNTVGIMVQPTEVGRGARILLETPADGYVEIENHVVTSSSSSRRNIRVERTIDEEKKTVKFALTGQIPSDADATKIVRTIPDPTGYFMATFQSLLSQHGISVGGKHLRGTTPADADLLLQQRSVPLSNILAEMNKTSNNFMAETVLRTTGAEVFGLPGTTEKGVKVVQEYLTSIGVDKSEYALVNGSGLTRSAQLRPSVLDAVLVDMAHDHRVGNEFESSLAIAGLDGTLWRRLSDDPGRLRGKTGTLDGVHSLVGYVEAGNGRLYAFSFLTNNVHGDASQVKRLNDKFARRMFSVGAETAAAPGQEIRGSEAAGE
jgi:D-alanyl-D-alanine carboxypeptidase/D-alanyl-D-alanine-endopeptidase (penicillin-binding protein 4)